MYSIKCLKFFFIYFDYSVFVVLNVGWKVDGYFWIRKGDYLNDIMYYVEIEEGKNVYKKDIEVIKY